MKYKWISLLFAAVLLAGCQDPAAPSRDNSSALFTESTPESIPEGASFPEQTSSEILLPPDPVSLPGGVTFVFPDGWQSAEGKGALNAVSPDGALSVGAIFTSDGGAITLTPHLLESNVLSGLVKAWEAYGMTDVLGEMGVCLLAQAECPTVLLQGTYDRIPVFQKQIYLFLPDGYLTVTVTSYETDQTDYLLTLFS